MGKFVFFAVEYNLNIEDYARLKALQKNTKLSRRRNCKLIVLVMLNQGHSIEVVEAALGLDDNTICRYWTGYEEKGIETYLSDHYHPYGGNLTGEQEKQLATDHDEYFYEDVKPIIKWVLEEFGISYTPSGIRNLFLRLGFVYEQTKGLPSNAEEERQLEFLEYKLPVLLEEVEAEDTVVYYADVSYPAHNTETGRGWIRKGHNFEIDCNSGCKRVNINAVVNAMKPEHLVYDIADSFNAQSTQRLCRKLLRKHPGKKIYLICDNARWNRKKALQDWAKKDQRIEFVFLPPLV